MRKALLFILFINIYTSLSTLSGIRRQHYLACPLSMAELAGLTEEARKRAMERFRLLQPHLERNEPLTSVACAAEQIIEKDFPGRS